MVTPDGTPVGPGFSNKYLLGADANGRDVAVRVLYGGRNSLFVGFMAAVITTLLAVSLGLLAGYFRGPSDTLIRSVFDILWSFPVLLFAIALGTALAIGGLNLGPIHIEGGSLWIPTLVIGFVYIPYLGRPVRGQVLSLREKEFVQSCRGAGHGAAAHHVRRDPAQPRLDDPGVRDADRRQQHHHRGGAVVPRAPASSRPTRRGAT